jgi:hypothetical protein
MNRFPNFFKEKGKYGLFFRLHYSLISSSDYIVTLDFFFLKSYHLTSHSRSLTIPTGHVFCVDTSTLNSDNAFFRHH